MEADSHVLMTSGGLFFSKSKLIKCRLNQNVNLTFEQGYSGKSLPDRRPMSARWAGLVIIYLPV
jgi:hypothetical protein